MAAPLDVVVVSYAMAVIRRLPTGRSGADVAGLEIQVAAAVMSSHAR